MRFMFATGIENSYPTIKRPDGTRVRIDEMEKCGHYRHWRDDFRLVQELGIHFLRYGPAYYCTQFAADKYDWSFADDTMNELKRLKITPIVDLCHFGLPDFLESFQNPDFPRVFENYARAFAVRYPWVRH
jgi:beta-glucosidase/6-phospho-beta-glucosidase/beta-galactosidase